MYVAVFCAKGPNVADLSFDIAGAVDVWGEGGRESPLS